MTMAPLNSLITNLLFDFSIKGEINQFYRIYSCKKKCGKKHKLLSAFLRYLITQADKPFSTKVLPDTPASGR
jgi:hypothetical protein